MSIIEKVRNWNTLRQVRETEKRAKEIRRGFEIDEDGKSIMIKHYGVTLVTFDGQTKQSEIIETIESFRTAAITYV